MPLSRRFATNKAPRDFAIPVARKINLVGMGPCSPITRTMALSSFDNAELRKICEFWLVGTDPTFVGTSPTFVGKDSPSRSAEASRTTSCCDSHSIEIEIGSRQTLSLPISQRAAWKRYCRRSRRLGLMSVMRALCLSVLAIDRGVGAGF